MGHHRHHRRTHFMGRTHRVGLRLSPEESKEALTVKVRSIRDNALSVIRQAIQEQKVVVDFLAHDGLVIGTLPPSEGTLAHLAKELLKESLHERETEEESEGCDCHEDEDGE